MSTPRHVAIDARMIRYSGIGTSLRGLLHAWHENPPPFDLTLMGNPKAVTAARPGARVAAYEASIYGLAAALLPAPIGSADVVLVPHYAAPLFPRKPLVAIVHDLIHITHPTRNGSRLYMQARLKALRSRASFVVTPSRHTKVQLQTLHGFPAHRVLTLPWGPGLAGLAKPTPLPGEMLPKEPFLLAVGIHKPHKNWGFLLRHLARLWHAKKLALPLVVAGMNPRGQAALRHGAHALNVSDRVVFLPTISDGEMLGVYGVAAALVFPSLVEGFGFPVVEAMAMGTPVIAANLPPMNEIGGGAIAYFDPDAPESFDRAVLGVIGDEKRHAELAAEGRERAAAFSWKKLGEQMADVMGRAVKERTRD